ncbi:hypothetical protein HYH02_013183 [Chlamydomonas schloesseri]|uniref:Uncharacterized protein n=1 Tax=Chlamydomonas schloesseri TaxID=2026947 RepID=A0A835VWI3_9CHLO|nr:hypothetical protein HYH02_013183 [Chlamydomonas schloesseri]|eukprot:KAG2431967.1 hypothetical protein HYH02_013183 [Chlamydomonas schloesseri]
MSKDASAGPSFLRFNLAQSLDVSSVVPASVSSLIRGLYPKCVCFHPTKPLLAVGVSGYVAVYDLQSNSRVGRVDLKSVPVELAFAPDGSVLIVVVQDWMVYSVSTSSWKSRLLVPRRAKMDKPLSSCMLAVAPGSNPFIYFCRYAKDTLRLATLPSRGGAPAADAAAAAAARDGGKDGGPSRAASSASGWGSRVKLDVQKAILGLACHVVDAQLMVLTADGQLRGYAIAGGGGDVMTPLWAVQVQDAADKVVPPLGVLTCVPHPAVAGGALILQGSRTGTATVLEAPGRSTPSQVVRGRVPNWAATIGMGFDKASSTVLAFGLSEGGGRLKCVSWRLGYRLGASGVAMRPSRVEPQDITNMLDSTRRTKAALATSMAAGAAAAAAAASGPGGPAASASQRNLTAGGAAGGGGSGGAGNGSAATPAWHGLWNVTPGWSHDVSSSCLLENQLAPVMSRVAVHPSLGVIAAAAEPSVAVQVNRELLFSGRGALSAEEINLARRTATVSLLTVTNLEAHACGWRGGRAAPQHTGLTTWLPPGVTAAAAAAAAAAVAHDDSSSDDEAAQPPAPAAAAGAAAGGGEGSGSTALQLPPHVYYLAGNRLMKYSLVTRSSGTVAMLPTDAPDGDTRTPRQLVYSPKRAAWLIFFESQAAAAAGAAASGGGANGAAAAAAAPERFTWTYVTAAGLGVGGSEGGAGPQSWVRAGKYGCFVGPSDEHFAVVSANGRLLELFDSAAPLGQLAAGRPLLSCVMDGGVLLPGLGAPLFAGPPMFNAPVPEARAPADAAPHDLRRFRGAGCVLWQSADMQLSLATLPALARVPLDAPAPGAGHAAGGGAGGGGDSSDEDDPNADASGAYYPTLGHGHHFGNVGRQAALPLLPNETVLHVAWQSLTLAAAPAPAAAAPPKAKKPAAEAAEADGSSAEALRVNSTFAGAAAAIAAAKAAAGGVSAAAAARTPQPGLGGPTDAVAAVLTTQRLMIVTAALRVVASVSLAPLGCPAAAAEPLTSVVWAGPMLLASTAAGQVLQLTWTGQLLPVAALSPTGHVALLGVSGDSLLLLRSLLGSPPVGAAAAAAGGNAAAAAALAEAVSRPASLLQPLLIGWASLAATGLLSYGGASPSAAAVVRPALRHALASYDAAAVTPRGVWALIAAGAWDVAAAVAAHMPPLDAAVKLAAAAAAGEWGNVAAALAAEARRALHAPLPPPRGSELHSKLVAAAAGALFHGQLSKAGELFQAAGEWPAAMILAVCSGNLQGVHAIAAKLAGEGGHGAPAAPPSPDAPQASQLASALRSLYGGSGSGPVADLTLRMEPLLLGPQALPAVGAEPELERAENWALAPPHASPAAVAVAGALPRASAVLSDGELGPIPSAEAGRATAVAYYALTATAAASVAAAAGGSSAALRPDGGAASGRGAGGTESSSHRGPGGGGTSAGDNLETTSVASSDAAQAAARAEFLGAGGFSALGGGPAIDFSSDDDSDSEATSAAGSSAVGGAGAAAQRRIKIQIRDAKTAAAAAGGPAAAGPTGGDASLREAAKGLRLAPPGAASSSRLAVGSGVAAPTTGLTPVPSTGLSPALSAQPSGGGTYQFPPGMSSAQLYAGGVGLMETGDWRGAAAHFSRAMSVLNHEERAAMDEASRKARLAFCANYYAAVRLLEGVGSGAGGREARLYRYLSALRLDAKHADALLREAITRNKALRNYRYAGDQLTALIGRVADTAPGDYLAQLQAEIEDCDRHGGNNADLPLDEQTGDWSALVAAAGESGGSKEDVDALVLPLL